MISDLVLVYILGTGHCGSTLLDLLLDAHPDIKSLGEVDRIGRHARSQDPVLERTFWKRIRSCYEKNAKHSLETVDLQYPPWRQLDSWSHERRDRWESQNRILLGCLGKVSGTRFLTDSSKFPHRLRLLLEMDVVEIRVIHLVRDGRAVVNSYLRKYGDFWHGFRRWAGPTLLSRRLRCAIQSQHWLEIRYEDLATDPETELRRVCSFLDLSHDDEMGRIRKEAYEGIGGNRMRWNSSSRIQLDERWRTELGAIPRLAFALLGGWLNRLYGY